MMLQIKTTKNIIKILIIGGSGWGKTNEWLNLIKKQDDIDNIYLHAKDLSEPKYEFLIKKRENAGIKHLNNSNAFIEYSQSIDDVYNNIDDYNLTRKRIFFVCLMIWLQIFWLNKFSSCSKRIAYKMQKVECIYCSYHTVLLFSSKRS